MVRPEKAGRWRAFGGQVHYSAGPASLLMFAAAGSLRHATILWSGAWILLDAAGALFGLYFLVLLGLLLIGSAERFRDRHRAR
jgi:hypothetical protein